ncbi:MAG TPA: hypothetical protein VN709_11275 [Terriglobales bacterium]|nr:hypothetical protein [Terriglobales bacterium]
MAKKKRRSFAPVFWLVGVVILAAAAWLHTYRRSNWDQLFTRRSSTAAGTAPAGCFVPASLDGHALDKSKQAAFATIEQLPKLAPGVYRVQARLVSYSLAPGKDYDLVLASLTNPALTITAQLPAAACVANQDDGALYDELREDINLRFGAASTAAVHPPDSPTVIVTGISEAGGHRLAPVLDFRVQ